VPFGMTLVLDWAELKSFQDPMGDLLL